jgi:hypothetical protein
MRCAMARVGAARLADCIDQLDRIDHFAILSQLLAHKCGVRDH